MQQQASRYGYKDSQVFPLYQYHAEHKQCRAYIFSQPTHAKSFSF
jgi:hypothetical protein